ncbi:MAG: response regulator, partial [Lachnospiraceae bacterium]|nr:response regulator [Lachnospiraceae bacterium]
EEEDVIAFIVAEDYSNQMARAENKDRFIFDMSHDVRTPMNAIMGYTPMAKKYINEPEKALECLEKLELSGEQLLKIINDAFDLARIESGKVVLDEDEANIIDCLDRLVEMVDEQAREKNISLFIDTEDVENAEAIFDEIKVGRIVYNILSNAIKFSPNNGKVSISICLNTDPSTPEGFANYQVIVADNGVGMSRDFVDNHLFETFSGRHTTTLTGIKGVGLGMSIARRLIELMNGKLSVESEPGKGTKITCHFCFRKIDYKSENNPSAHGSSLMGTRILLVEDNELNREIERDCLESEGIIVDEAVNGKEALDKIVASAPEAYLCVLMDVMMPVMDGVEATLKIRNLPDSRKAMIPIIAMTANAFGEDKERCLKAGMNGYLVKPIRNEKLLEVINELA